MGAEMKSSGETLQLTINGVTYAAPVGATLLQTCRLHGIEIPVFCYHDRLSIAGNCRMCLVQVENTPKPVASCAMPVSPGMVVWTQSEMVRHAREGVLEFLLANHPLDCPICDQGGECDLQDITMAYGADRGHCTEQKRAVLDKDLGPFIDTHMTRCIHCTRCVRFMNEIAGAPELCAEGRGETMEITAALEGGLSSELSGNIIDLCPVGALLSKPYAFRARAWELAHTTSIDVLDAVGSNIRIDTRGNTVMRILPQVNEAINEAWISDKARFAYDGLRVQRLDTPYVRRKGQLVPASWDEAFNAITHAIKSGPTHGAGIIGDLVDLESIFALQTWFARLGAPYLEARQDGTLYDVSHPEFYTFNTTIQGLESADALLLIGTDPRLEAALINARIYKRWRHAPCSDRAGDFPIGVIGTPLDVAYPTVHLGETAETLHALAQGKPPFSSVLKGAKNPALILGQGALQGRDGPDIQRLALQCAQRYGMLRSDWVGFNMLHTAAARVGALMMGCHTQGGMETLYRGIQSGAIQWVYLLGADGVDFERLKGAFLIYQGHHGDLGATHADVILPGAAYSEKNGLYVNTEGRVQQAWRAVSPPGMAREDWQIIADLARHMEAGIGFADLDILREAIAISHPRLALRPLTLDFERAATELQNLLSLLTDMPERPVGATPLQTPIQNFYQTDVISRASKAMAEGTLFQRRREATRCL